MTKHTECTVCGGTRLRPMSGYERFHLGQCARCGFVFALAIPTLEELERHYQGYGRNDYLSPLTIAAYHKVLDSFEPYRKTNRLIDVGCGIGYFLEVAKERGWEVHGTEFTDKAVEICTAKGISMRKGPLDPANYPEGSFDVITSFEVIEHINNPREELSYFNTLLRKGGLVYLTTPNFNSLERLYLKDRYNVIAYPEHLSYYTPSTLTRVFKGAGFKRKSVQTTGISLSRFKSSQGKATAKLISAESDDERLRQQISSNPMLGIAKDAVNATLTLFGVGNSLKGWFVKA